jgi:hypothetical protein
VREREAIESKLSGLDVRPKAARCSKWNAPVNDRQLRPQFEVLHPMGETASVPSLETRADAWADTRCSGATSGPANEAHVARPRRCP